MSFRSEIYDSAVTHYGWDRYKLEYIAEYLYKKDIYPCDQNDFCIIFNDHLLYKNTDGTDLIRAVEASQETKEQITTCFADGSGTTSEREAGIGMAIYEYERDPVFIAHKIGLGTNNKAELMALWGCLRAVPDRNRQIYLLTDSEYARGMCTKDWAIGANEELILKIRADIKLRKGNVTISHVDGHSGVEGNEIVDKLANVGRKLITKPCNW